MRLPVMPPVAPMLAKPVAGIPPGQLYEPKWDGFRAIVFRDGDAVEIGSRNERPMSRYFPEVCDAIRASAPPRCVLDGEIVVAERGRAHARLLGAAAAPAPGGEPRGAAGRRARRPRSSPSTCSRSATRTSRAGPFRERRAALEAALAGAAPPVHLTPLTRDEAVARTWFERFEGAGLDGVIAKDPETPTSPASA